MSDVGANRRFIVEFEAERGVRKGLQASADPINENTAAIIESVKEQEPLELTRRLEARHSIEGPVPYGLHLLSYTALKELAHNGQLTEIPNSPEAIAAAAAAFQPKRLVPHRLHGKSIYEQMASQARARLQQLLHAVAAPEATDGWEQAIQSYVPKEIDREEWEQYLAAAHINNIAALDAIAYTALRSVAFSEKFGVPHLAKGRHCSFLFTSEQPRNLQALLQLPIGPYGQALTKRLALAQSYMIDFDERDYNLRNNGVTRENYELIRDHTTRARGFDVASVSDSFVGGIVEADQQSLPGALLLLASSPVPGFEPHQSGELIEQLITDDLPDKLTLLARQALVATSVRNGVYIPNLVTKRPDGHLDISAEGHDCLQALQEISDKIGVDAIKNYLKSQGNTAPHLQNGELDGRNTMPALHTDVVRTFTHCPFAGKDQHYNPPKPSVITNRAYALLAVFKKIQPTRDIYFIG